MTSRKRLSLACACALALWTPVASAELRGVQETPRKPDGVADANWIQTNPQKGFFAYFRWYSPTKAFFDRSWKMGNIIAVK